MDYKRHEHSTEHVNVSALKSMKHCHIQYDFEQFMGFFSSCSMSGANRCSHQASKKY